MKNLIPQHLFEMAKYSENDMIEKMSEVLDVIFTYDYIELIDEIYGETIKCLRNTYGNDSVVIKSEPFFRLKKNNMYNFYNLYKKDKFVSILKKIFNDNLFYTDIFCIFDIQYMDDSGETTNSAHNCGMKDFNTLVINPGSYKYVSIPINSVIESKNRVFDIFLKKLEYEMLKTKIKCLW